MISPEWFRVLDIFRTLTANRTTLVSSDGLVVRVLILSRREALCAQGGVGDREGLGFKPSNGFAERFTIDEAVMKPTFPYLLNGKRNLTDVLR